MRLLTPEGAVFDDLAYMVIASSVMGEVGILPRHTPFIAFLRMGVAVFSEFAGQQDSDLFGFAIYGSRARPWLTFRGALRVLNNANVAVRG